jgi:hypothetical protein
VKRQSRAAAAGARCRSRADVAGWRGRWQCTATRHSLPAVRAAAARRPLAGCVCAIGCRPSQTHCHRGRACGAEWPPGEARCISRAHRRRRRGKSSAAACVRSDTSVLECVHIEQYSVNNQQQHSQHPKSGYSTRVLTPTADGAQATPARGPDVGRSTERIGLPHVGLESGEIPSWSFCRCSRGGQLGHWRDPRVRQPIDQIGHTAHAELEHALLT